MDDLRNIIITSLFTTLTAIGAFIKIPTLYIPLTLQSFFVILSGNILGAKYGALSQIVYLFLGLSGLPIFAYGGGISYVLHPTFGYLCAYPLAAYISGKLIHRIFRSDNNSRQRRRLFLNISLANTVAVIFIFIIGMSYLYINLNFITGRSIDMKTCMISGFIIFLPGDLLKIIGASMITVKIKTNLRGSKWKN